MYYKTSERRSFEKRLEYIDEEYVLIVNIPKEYKEFEYKFIGDDEYQYIGSMTVQNIKGNLQKNYIIISLSKIENLFFQILIKKDENNYLQYHERIDMNILFKELNDNIPKIERNIKMTVNEKFILSTTNLEKSKNKKEEDSGEEEDDDDSDESSSEESGDD